MLKSRRLALSTEWRWPFLITAVPLVTSQVGKEGYDQGQTRQTREVKQVMFRDRSRFTWTCLVDQLLVRKSVR